MKFGLNTQDFETLERLVIIPLKRLGLDLYAFGSRTRTKHHPFSDLDILVANVNETNIKEYLKVKEAIEEARFPIKIDFVLEEHLADSYREQVNKEKIRI